MIDKEAISRKDLFKFIRILRDYTWERNKKRNIIIMRLSAQWISGFTDGEGCFHIGISKHSQMTTGYQVLPEFIIVQHKRDIKLLYNLKAYFGCGVVRKNKGSGNIYSYRVRNRAHLMNIIIPFFEKHSLKTMKKVDFQKFRKVLLMMERNEHLTLTGLDAIRKIRRQKSLISQDRAQPQ